jgi:glycosyltransferase involved in cell wall biosynthesis
MEKTKVVFVIPSLDAGGIENYVLSFIIFSKLEIRPVVIVRNYKKGIMFTKYTKVCDEIYFAPIGTLNFIKKWRFYKLINSLRSQVIVDFNSNFAGWTMLLSKLAGYKRRITFYRQGKDHFEKNFFNSTYNKILNRMVYSFSTQILSNSFAALSYFFPYRGKIDKFQVIYNGIDLEKFSSNGLRQNLKIQLKLAENRFIIGHSGRLDPLKNQDLILKLAKYFQTKNPRILFVLLGQGTEALAKESFENVFALGYKSNVNEYLRSFDAFIFPSFSEGQPSALIEAIATDLPFLASDIPSIRECVTVDYAPRLISPSDFLGFIEGIEDLLSNPDDYKADQRHVSTNFNIQMNFKKFLKTLF